ncbi:P-loop containing nucleoside triphosphate hydrolase protein [Aspergillus japonicus CBS 114.51]|uniref:DNA 3'-5' helicase n=1 Tax=Aspergillus japonicus CBS 114.51 TaxID=1448312 RepID=A0A8T8X8Q0_ASPJA|nr:P-loop containing nucleoside triphosphate hydrolase protein [Aspergillus japonicus CBS 114.51]RAH84441.1 P-loop containing nucleoside triphosphate hydrolase protein [Aspergillus japonicus CBS 114.51]
MVRDIVYLGNMRRDRYHFRPSPRQRTLPERRAELLLRTPSRFTHHANRTLEEDARVSPYFSRQAQQTPESYLYENLHTPPFDTVQELDAFDLELLAQSNAQTRGLLQPNADGDGYSAPSRFESVVHPRRARHPHDVLQVSPRDAGSSSSGVGIISPSSPLLRLQAQRGTANPIPRYPSDTRTDIEPLYNASSNSERPSPSLADSGQSGHSQLGQATSSPRFPASVRGIVLVSVHELPDKYRAIFPFPVFNAIQSKSFQSVYRSDHNIVLSAPTGSGKTVIMELAICRLMSTSKDERFKVIYQAPTKSLCSERFRDWNGKFLTLGLQCAELTGDTDHTQLKSVQNSQIIITTPEKWDSVTRKWKDHARLMQLVKLFLIDEVHILKEARGATLEAVVSRMKTNGSNVRFVALSATVPNSEDIATWLGRDATNQHLPAQREHFDESFRPVKLQKFVYGYRSQGNDFAFDKMCNTKLPDLIKTHSCKKPIIVFCCTRLSAVSTAKELARLWSMSNPPARLWKGASRHLGAHNADLEGILTAGVAFHHAGLDSEDRRTVETGFLQGHISIICCTSTLAVGVNLPCHLVVIKGTVGWQGGGCGEYSDLEIMQMLGRAGRPQFDNSATAVIMTRKERESHYEKLVSGSGSLESCLHLNLIDHLNAEIGLGNVTDINSAIRWLGGTFLFVRLRRNPAHYQLKERADGDGEDEMLRQICEKDIKLLQEYGLVTVNGLQSTSFGEAMARYYVRFETMKNLLALKPQSTVSQILSVVAQAEEFLDIRLKAGEKSLYKEINRSNGIRFPIKVDIALSAHKISLLVQSELGAVDFPDGEQFQKFRFVFQQDTSFVFSHINRLIRCIIDCQISLEDAVTLRNALELARSFGAKVWDNSPLQMRQLEQVGIVTVRKLAAANITSIEALGQCEPHRIDMILSKNPPFGAKLLERVATFPRLRVAIKMAGKEVKPAGPVRIRLKAEIAFMNDKCPSFYLKRPVYVCFLAEVSDGRLLEFRRISANKVSNGQEILLSAELTDKDQFVSCSVSCDDIAGTLRSAVLKPELPPTLFFSRPNTRPEAAAAKPPINISSCDSNDDSQSKRPTSQSVITLDSDESLFDRFLQEEDESWSLGTLPAPSGNKRQKNGSGESKGFDGKAKTSDVEEPTPMENGRWACNHRCKDKTVCKHFCCRDGLDKPPKASKKQPSLGAEKPMGLNQTTLPVSMTRKDGDTAGAELYGLNLTKESSASMNRELQKGPDHASENEPAEPWSSGGPNDGVSPGFHESKPSREPSDDTFSDFPSPAALLLGDQTNAQTDNGGPCKKVEMDADTLDLEDNWSDDDVWLAVQSPLEIPSSTEKTKVQNTPSSADRVDSRSNGQPKQSGEEPPFIATRGKKRKLSSSNDDNMKRIKSNGQLVEEECNKENSPPEELQGVASAEQVVVPKGWEDIEPALLEEFKDIINLF